MNAMRMSKQRGRTAVGRKVHSWGCLTDTSKVARCACLKSWYVLARGVRHLSCISINGNCACGDRMAVCQASK